MLHVVSALCVTHDLRTIAPGPLERTCWRQFAAQWGDCKKSQIAPLIEIIIIILSYYTHSYVSCWCWRPSQPVQSPQGNTPYNAPGPCPGRLLSHHILDAYCLSNMQCGSLEWIILDNLTCCHTERKVADQTCNLTQPQHTDAGPHNSRRLSG